MDHPLAPPPLASRRAAALRSLDRDRCCALALGVDAGGVATLGRLDARRGAGLRQVTRPHVWGCPGLIL